MVDAEFLVPTLKQGQDLIVLAQRGTLDATPSLLCPEIDAFEAKAVSLVYDAPSTGVLHVAATKACHDRFVSEGIDLSAYNTSENIEDFEDLRKVLKVDKWSIFGTSYGTYLALVLMRIHPENLVSVAIDSITPPSVASLGWTWSSAGEGFNNLFDECNVQPSCASKYGRRAEQVHQPGPATRGQTAHHHEHLHPGGPPVQVVLDGRCARELVVAGGRALSCQYLRQYRSWSTAPGSDCCEPCRIGNPAKESTQGYGLTFGVFCSEWIPFQPQSQILADGLVAFPTYPTSVLSQAPQLPFATQDCGVWDVPKASASIRDVTASNIPTLVIDGTYDGKTSPMWATYVAKTLSNSTTIIIPGIGHLVTPQSECAQTVVQEFLADPTTPPDTSCVAGLTPPPFK